MKRAWAVALGVAIFASTGTQAQNAPRRGDQAGMFDGEWYVTSDSGYLIPVATGDHCSEAQVEPDQQTIFCRAVRRNADGSIAGYLGLEVYHRNGSTVTISPEGGPFVEWRIWNGGSQVVLEVYDQELSRHYELYDAATGKLLENVGQLDATNSLPAWAKSRSLLAAEAVPENDALNQERTMWIGKVMREIARIQPGMTRKDVLRVMTTEGGISTRTQRTYVYPGCPYIKVVVRFTPVGPADQSDEGPDDKVDSVSRPYLEYSIMD